MIEKLIIQIINKEKIFSQEQLLQRLIEKTDTDIDQSTLSRKLKKLKIIKKDGIYKAAKAQTFVSKQVIRYIRISEPNLIIIRTTPGVATSIALIIDLEIDAGTIKFSEIMGTLAGDDTIFIAVKNTASLKSAKKQIELLLL